MPQRGLLIPPAEPVVPFLQKSAENPAERISAESEEIPITAQFSPQGGNCAVMGISELAAGEGFEPSHTESESAVLPLHKPAILRCFRKRKHYYTKYGGIVKRFLSKNVIGVHFPPPYPPAW